jgi:hypothetical protein
MIDRCPVLAAYASNVARWFEWVMHEDSAPLPAAHRALLRHAPDAWEPEYAETYVMRAVKRELHTVAERMLCQGAPAWPSCGFDLTPEHAISRTVKFLVSRCGDQELGWSVLAAMPSQYWHILTPEVLRKCIKRAVKADAHGAQSIEVMARVLRATGLSPWSRVRWEYFESNELPAALLNELHPVLRARVGGVSVGADAAQLRPLGRERLRQLARSAHPPDKAVVGAERGVLGPNILWSLSDLEAGGLPQNLEVVYVTTDGEREPARDAGGLTVHWLCDVARNLSDPNYGWFRPATANSSFSTPTVIDPANEGTDANEDRLHACTAMGVVIGEAILRGFPLPVRLPTFLLKQLLQIRPNFSDLKQVDPDLARHLERLRQLDACTLESYGLRAEYSTTTACGSNLDVEILADGGNVALTTDNLELYIEALLRWYFTERFDDALCAMARGLFNRIPADVLRAGWSRPEELELAISGDANLDPADWRINTGYELPSTAPDAPLSIESELTADDAAIIERFWRVVTERFNDADRRRLLHFVANITAAPAGGFERLNPCFSIQLCADRSRLPVAHTCFNQLDLPAYADDDTMEAKLRQAMASEDFGLV